MASVDDVLGDEIGVGQAQRGQFCDPKAQDHERRRHRVVASAPEIGHGGEPWLWLVFKAVDWWSGRRARAGCELWNVARRCIDCDESLWLDSWPGLRAVTVGMARKDYDLQLTQYGDHAWRARSYRPSATLATAAHASTSY